MVLGDVEETVTTVEADEETQEELIKVSCAHLQWCYKRHSLNFLIADITAKY